MKEIEARCPTYLLTGIPMEFDGSSRFESRGDEFAEGFDKVDAS
jgi:hypothetical protein